MSRVGRVTSSLTSRFITWGVTGLAFVYGSTDTCPLVSSTAYFTAARSLYPWLRSCSSSSSTVKRLRAMFCWRILPSRMMTVGWPQTSPRNRMDFRLKKLSSMDRHSSVTMGNSPLTIGIPKSCMGTAARSEIISVSTSSLGSSSPICRFPISRRPTMRIKYKITVRKNAVVIVPHPFQVSICRKGAVYACRTRKSILRRSRAPASP